MSELDDPSLGPLTLDPIRRGELVLLQPARGYRFTIDPLLLADFVATSLKPQRERTLELCDVGAGSGIIGLVLLRRITDARLTAIELQPRLAELARRNISGNALGDRAQVVEVDMASPRAARTVLGGRFDCAVSNPPYQAMGRGHTNPDEESAIARHDLRLPLPRLVAELRRLLRPRGHAAVIYPVARLGELIAEATATGLAPRRLRLVQPRLDAAATRALVLFEKGGAKGQLEALPALVERHADGSSTDELQRITGD